MSYLNPLRLHFAGKFQAAPSTVNNDGLKFNNATFMPNFQKLNNPNDPTSNGWWNPTGDADWRLIGCNVTAAWLADGSPADAGDPVLTYLIADSDRRPPAKLVDLDPGQQMNSMIYGLEVRICNQDGETLLRSQYEPAPFKDIWFQAQAPDASDQVFGAIYQSVLTDLEWGDVEQSPFLKELRAAAQDGLLSIKFNVDGYNVKFGTPEFTRGRIVGTIGPASASEPHHMTLGRQFMMPSPQSPPPPPPNPDYINYINYFVAIIDPKRRKILLDLGNALPTTMPGGPFADRGTLTLGYELPVTGDQVTPQWITLDALEPALYTTPDWYNKTAAVVELPSDGSLTDKQLEDIAANPLALRYTTPSDGEKIISEQPVYVRPDQLDFRLSPGEQAVVRMVATRFGQPYAGVQIGLVLDPGQLQATFDQNGNIVHSLDPGLPTDALTFSPTVTAGQDGVAIATITASAPGNPRTYIDGQVYGVRPSTEETRASDYPENPSNFSSILVWDAFTHDEPPTWWGSLQPIFQQYANLYPIMGRFLDLGDYESVCDNLDLLRFAFGLDPANPNSMPVTRDLSPAKRATILQWLGNPGPDGKPLLGTQPPPPLMAETAEAEETTTAAEETPQRPSLGGGKLLALSRRLALRSSGDKS